MSEHTPGPWRLAEQGLGENAAVFPAQAVAPCIADCNAGPKGECLANAILVASAPDLLEALQTLVREQQYFAQRMPGNDFYSSRFMAVVNLAKAAIAKAEGREP